MAEPIAGITAEFRLGLAKACGKRIPMWVHIPRFLQTPDIHVIGTILWGRMGVSPMRGTLFHPI